MINLVTNIRCIRYNSGASYHHNRRSGRHDRELRERDRERDRMERDGGPMDRDRDRLHARERDLVHYDLNEEDLLNERSYGGEFSSRDRHDRGVDRGDRHDRLDRMDRGGERLLERGERIIDRGDRMLEPERIRTLERGDRPLIHRGGSGHCEDSELLRDRDSARYGGDRSVAQSIGVRRERESYSPHRGGGNNRRVLNAM